MSTTLRQPTPFRISTYTMGGYICSDLNEKDSILPLYVFSRLLPITTDNDDADAVAAKNSKSGCYVAISDYIDNDYTDMPRGRIAEDTRVYKLPSQVFNNQISLRFKYWGFRCISYKLFSNGQMQFTGIMDPKWEPHHIATELIKVIHELKYTICLPWSMDITKTKYVKNNLDYMLYWNADAKRVDYLRRNLEIYDFTGILKSGIVTGSSDSTWLNHQEVNKLITQYFEPIADEKKHLEGIMDRLRNIPEFTIDIRRAIFENEKDGLGRYRKLTALDTQFAQCPDIEFRRLVQKTVKKLLKTFDNYEERLRKLMSTDQTIANNVNTLYRKQIMTKLKQLKKSKSTPSVLEYPTEMSNKAYRPTNISIDLINSDFNTRYINLLPIISVLLKKSGIYNYYQPNNKYPGIIARFAYNPRHIPVAEGGSYEGNIHNIAGNEYIPGKCYCNPRCVAGSKTGRNIPEGQCIFITVNIFRTGSVMITSARNIDQIQHVYKWVNAFFKKHASQIFQELPDGRDYALENEDRNIVKKSELHYVPRELIVFNDSKC